VPEVELGFATGAEGGDFLVAGVIPEEELLGGGLVAAEVEVGEQGGGGETALAEVETEIDQCVELALNQRHTDEAADGLLGFAISSRRRVEAFASVRPSGKDSPGWSRWP
jgi:hypothetical protein